MSSQSIEEILKRLPKNQAAVLYWKCQGLKYEDIGTKLNYSIEWVTLQMSYVYARFDLKDKKVHWAKRQDFLKNEVCPVLQKLTNGNPNKLDDFPLVEDDSIIDASETSGEPDPTTYPLVVYDEMVLEETHEGKIVIPSKGKKRPRPSYVLILLVIIGCLVFGYVGYRLGSSGTPEVALAEVTSTFQPTDIPPIPTETSVIFPSDTPPPSETPFPTDTPPPSATPTESFAFYDDFSDGLDSAWNIVYGKPVVADGQLVAGEETLLSVGDPAWMNYQIEFDVKMGRFTCQDSQSSFLGVRATDIDNMLRFRFHPCETEWSSVTGGSLSVISNTFDGNQGFTNTFVHFTVKVEVNEISVHAKSVSLNSFIDTDHPSGFIYLRIRPDTLFDNFKITLLNP